MLCCVCGHLLSKHVSDGDGWRCQCLAKDANQCECWLRKIVAGGVLEYYDQHRRLNEFLEKVTK